LWKQERETPVYLLKKGKRDLALKSVQFYFQLSQDDAEEKLLLIEERMLMAGDSIQKSAWKAITERKNRKALCMSILTSSIMNFSGIIAITIYGTELLTRYGGLSSTTAGFVNCFVFTSSLAGLILAIFVIKDLSHRRLLLVGLPLLLLIDILFLIVMLTTKDTLAFILLAVLIVAFCLVFSNTIEKVTAFYGSKYTSPEYIDAVSSITVVSIYLNAFLASTIFYPINNRIHEYSFMIFIIALILSWICFLVWYPSTEVQYTSGDQSVSETSSNSTSEIQQRNLKVKSTNSS